MALIGNTTGNITLGNPAAIGQYTAPSAVYMTIKAELLGNKARIEDSLKIMHDDLNTINELLKKIETDPDLAGLIDRSRHVSNEP